MESMEILGKSFSETDEEAFPHDPHALHVEALGWDAV
jgi:hypothetical protein